MDDSAVRRAVLLLDLDRGDDAARELRDHLSRYPEDPEALAQLADIHRTRSEFTRALELSEQALLLKPEQDLAMLCRAGALLGLEHAAEAVAAARACLEKRDTNWAYFIWGEALLLQKRREEALAIFARGAERCPDFHHCQLALCREYLDAGKLGASESICLELLEANAEGRGLRELAQVRILQGRIAEAQELLLRNLSLRPEDRLSRSLYRDCLVRQFRLFRWLSWLERKIPGGLLLAWVILSIVLAPALDFFVPTLTRGDLLWCLPVFPSLLLGFAEDTVHLYMAWSRQLSRMVEHSRAKISWELLSWCLLVPALLWPGSYPRSWLIQLTLGMALACGGPPPSAGGVRAASLLLVVGAGWLRWQHPTLGNIVLLYAVQFALIPVNGVLSTLAVAQK